MRRIGGAGNGGEGGYLASVEKLSISSSLSLLPPLSSGLSRGRLSGGKARLGGGLAGEYPWRLTTLP